MTTPTLSPEHCQQDASWAALVRQLPPDLDALAFQQGALFRKRKFPSAALLLRLLLAYATGLSMPLVTAWAAQIGLIHLTPEALQRRLAQARHWLQALVLHLLTGQARLDPAVRRLRLVDGTHAPRPGARSQDWRLHLCLDLQHGTLAEACVLPQRPGESFARLPLQAGDLVVGDRNYGKRPGLLHVVQAGADVLVRFVAKNLPLQTPEGTPFALAEHLPILAEGATGEWTVQIAPTRRHADGPPVRGRVIAYRLPAALAERATRAQRRRRSRSGRQRTAQAATVAGWQYVLLFTTVSAAVLPAPLALRLYRCRWQIELAIKRYKQLCGLGTLHTRTDACCQAVLWAKLLLIVWLEQRGRETALFSPGAGGDHGTGESVADDGAALVDARPSHCARRSVDRGRRRAAPAPHP